MKRRNVALTGIISIIVLAIALGTNGAEAEKQQEQKGCLKIGVVNIRSLFENSKRHEKYQTEASAEQNRIVAELEQLGKEIDAGKTGLRAFKEGSDDYMNSVRELLNKQAKLEAEQEFYKQRFKENDKAWTENFYIDIMKQVEAVASKKGLDLVLEKDQIQLPAENANDLMLAIRTHKILYCGGCIDITGDVLAALDSME
ncbi:MAG: OmpH family outer membrane protein [Phycisphaerae bacterium]|nr:OmpH family outer membrane protein [Phycisphaerae bacterium]